MEKQVHSKKQQKQMQNSGKTDETFEINLKKSQINNFFTESVKKFARKTRELKVRIVFVKLKTGETEILFTNLPTEIATPEELKELYGSRWTIEKDYDRLKNELHIEKFTGKKENNHRTRLLQSHIPIQCTNSTQT